LAVRAKLIQIVANHLQLKLIAPLIAGEVLNISQVEHPEAWTWIRS